MRRAVSDPGSHEVVRGEGARVEELRRGLDDVVRDGPPRPPSLLLLRGAGEERRCLVVVTRCGGGDQVGWQELLERRHVLVHERVVEDCEDEQHARHDARSLSVAEAEEADQRQLGDVDPREEVLESERVRLAFGVYLWLDDVYQVISVGEVVQGKARSGESEHDGRDARISDG